MSEPEPNREVDYVDATTGELLYTLPYYQSVASEDGCRLISRPISPEVLAAWRAARS